MILVIAPLALALISLSQTANVSTDWAAMWLHSIAINATQAAVVQRGTTTENVYVVSERHNDRGVGPAVQCFELGARF